MGQDHDQVVEGSLEPNTYLIILRAGLGARERVEG